MTNKTDSKVHPEEALRDGSNPENKVQDQVNESKDDLLITDDEKVYPDKEVDEIPYSDEAGTPVV